MYCCGTSVVSRYLLGAGLPDTSDIEQGMLKQMYRQSACCLRGPAGQQHSAAQLLYLRAKWSRAKRAEICPISGNTSGPYQMDTSTSHCRCRCHCHCHCHCSSDHECNRLLFNFTSTALSDNLHMFATIICLIEKLVSVGNPLLQAGNTPKQSRLIPMERTGV